MIRMGRYDAFDKWNMLCRAWAGEVIDVGVDRHGRPCLSQWRTEAFSAGEKYLLKFLDLKCDALAARDPIARAADSELTEFARQIGVDEFRDRVRKLIDHIGSAGFGAAAGELPANVAARLKDAFKFGAVTSLRWTEDVGEIPDIETLREKRWPFPRRIIRGKRNVLDLFCARQYGRLDVIHVYDACPDRVTLVDVDPVCLDVMKQIYPSEWTYICADYKEFLRDAEAQALVYDLVIADPWIGMCAEVGFDMFPAIADRCSDMLVFHYITAMFDELGAGLDDFEHLSRAIRRRTGVDVAIVGWARRSWDNGCLVMRKR